MPTQADATLPTLAVIVPCFNNAETLREALESAVSQDYPRFEIHVCDNNSTDGSQAIVESIASPRLRPALHRDTLPRTDNWNRAYAAGFDADYLVTLHADDRLAPGALRAIARAAAHRPVLVHGRFQQITYDGQPIPGSRFPLSYLSSGEAFQELLLLNNMVAMPGATVRTDTFRQIGCWDPAWEFLQDMELWWRCGDLGQVAYTAAHLGDHRAFKNPMAHHRHSQEHLRWAAGKLRDAATPRLRQAGADGLQAYLDRILRELPDESARPEGLRAAIAEARSALDEGPTPKPNAFRKQRLLRAYAALGTAARKAIPGAGRSA